jgi:hypothetical protein
MPSSIDIDRARVIPPINCRMGRAGTLKLIFNLNGAPYPLTAFDFESFARKGSGPRLADFSVTKGGDDDNELSIEFTAIATNKLPVDKYLWQLVNLTREETWLNADLNIHLGKFDALPPGDQEISINVADVIVDVSLSVIDIADSDIDGGSASSIYMADQIIDGGNS